VKIKPEDCSKTAFITKYGLFEFARMAFVLCNSPATYTRVINLVLRGLNWKVVLGKDFEGHLANIRAVLVRFREYGLKLSIFFNKGPMVIGEPQKPLHLLFILRPWPVFYIFDMRVINLVLRGLNWKVVLAFLVLGKDFEGHLANLRAVLVRFREYGLKLKPKKGELFQKEVEFLGRVVGPRGIYIGPGYIKDIKNWPRPNNKKEVESFLGFTNL
jgi:hypothetical protein